MLKGRAARLAGIASLALGPGAWAHGIDSTAGRAFDGPFIQGAFEASFRVDGPVATDFTPHRAAQMYLDDVNLGFGLHFNDWLSVQGNVRGEPLRTLRPHRSEAFRGFGLFMEQLFVDVDLGQAGFFIGKIRPTFGYLQDHHRAEGLFSVDFTEDYQTIDMIGAGFVLRGDLRDRGVGQHELTGQIFRADTTFLHRSIITAPRAGGSTVERQSRLRRSDGGLGNTGKFNNFSATLDSSDLDFLPELGIHLGYRFLHRSAAGRAAGTETRNEQGLAIAFDYTATMLDVLLSGRTTIKPSIEWVRFWNGGGQPGSVTYWGASVMATNGAWTWYLTGTLRNADAPGVVKMRDRLIATSLFYRFDEQWQLGAGYKYQRVRDSDTGKNTNDHVIGIRVAWNYDFAIGLKP
ncbi:hypothetical protein [Vineibacter terrae]|uniref:hypothetical protein n=1 Tax=Vineibacter terrae TaxID=2586908 RepID=UPI002E352C55|nr:hypothetical protein [Vineibacter terrae]HEX2888422.1 hypothetical protein [Vineibacter terrae]